MVLEIIDGMPRFYENKLGVLTNSPGFEWQLTNLNNYVNLFPGSAPTQQLGSTLLAPFGAGADSWASPGDVTPPSRFVRAAFYQATAPQAPSAEEAVRQCFQILNNFDIPHRHRECTRRKDIRAAQRDPMDIGHRPDKPCHLLPHDA